ncbi:hypothetical protein RCL_jg18420.t2 [Rhizophagus clarus]|uniref:Uncharacterized protein n=1 Tax=Rhizophagus clarus TaxID=94130 RepID=A0A8H3QP50_9GLOM|nr:hypothetical protein RCL_jg18420.t2 [Rhizophagus clarus]
MKTNPSSFSFKYLSKRYQGRTPCATLKHKPSAIYSRFYYNSKIKSLNRGGFTLEHFGESTLEGPLEKKENNEIGSDFDLRILTPIWLHRVSNIS